MVRRHLIVFYASDFSRLSYESLGNWQHTDQFIKSELEPSRSNFRGRLEEVFNYDKFSAPWRVGDFWFMHKQEGLSAQTVLYKQVFLFVLVTATAIFAEHHVLCLSKFTWS